MISFYCCYYTLPFILNENNTTVYVSFLAVFKTSNRFCQKHAICPKGANREKLTPLTPFFLRRFCFFPCVCVTFLKFGFFKKKTCKKKKWVVALGQNEEVANKLKAKNQSSADTNAKAKKAKAKAKAKAKGKAKTKEMHIAAIDIKKWKQIDPHADFQVPSSQRSSIQSTYTPSVPSMKYRGSDISPKQLESLLSDSSFTQSDSNITFQTNQKKKKKKESKKNEGFYANYVAIPKGSTKMVSIDGKFRKEKLVELIEIWESVEEELDWSPEQARCAKAMSEYLKRDYESTFGTLNKNKEVQRRLDEFRT
ncbi:hypothetical protein RFI_05882, partial [Reticulomyxa filosa]